VPSIREEYKPKPLDSFIMVEAEILKLVIESSKHFTLNFNVLKNSNLWFSFKKTEIKEALNHILPNFNFLEIDEKFLDEEDSKKCM